MANLRAKAKIGVEINDTARNESINQGVEAVKEITQIPDDWADVVISNNALEHTHHPLEILETLLPKVKKGGKLIFFVPCEAISYAFQMADINQHLYSWSPMALGNLFVLAGYKVVESVSFPYKWPNDYLNVFKKLKNNSGLFYDYCRKYAEKKEINNPKTLWHHVKVIAERPL